MLYNKLEVTSCSLLFAILKKEKKLKLRVHSIFDQAVNFTPLFSLNELDFKPSLITFLSKNKSKQAFSLTFATQEFDTSFFKINKEFILSENLLTTSCASYNLEIIDFFEPEINKLSDLTSQNHLSFLENKKFLKSVTSYLQYFLKQEGKREGICPLIFKEEKGEYSLNFSQKYIFEAWQKFTKNLLDTTNHSSKLDYFQNNFTEFVGYGSGLTPYMDDFLAGFILADFYIQNYNAKFELNKQVNWQLYVDKISAKTNKISAHLLQLSARGYGAESTLKLFRVLAKTDCYIQNNLQANLKKACECVLEFGHSSGTDTLCGIYLRFYLYQGGFL